MGMRLEHHLDQGSSPTISNRLGGTPFLFLGAAA